jgi:hypothetical protein
MVTVEPLPEGTSLRDGSIHITYSVVKGRYLVGAIAVIDAGVAFHPRYTSVRDYVAQAIAADIQRIIDEKVPHD